MWEEVVGVALRWRDDRLVFLTRVSTTGLKIG
jgi:hypothetical protein